MVVMVTLIKAQPEPCQQTTGRQGGAVTSSCVEQSSIKMTCRSLDDLVVKVSVNSIYFVGQ